MASLVGKMLQLVANTVESLEATSAERGTGKGQSGTVEDQSVQTYLASNGFWDREMICTVQAGNLDRGNPIGEGIPLEIISAERAAARNSPRQEQVDCGDTPIPGEWTKVEGEFPKEDEYIETFPESSQERRNDEVLRDVESSWHRKQQLWRQGYRAAQEMFEY